MNNSKKLSLSLINTLFLVLFLIVIVLGIFISIYYSTQRLLDYNINEYSKQTENITKIIFDMEQRNLNNIAVEISELLKLNNENIRDKILNANSVDQIDLLFIKKEHEYIDYSDSLFDTQNIINLIKKVDISRDNIILSLKAKNENFILFLSIKNIVDDKTGRVVSKLYIGKVLNDNFSILNEIKQKALLKDVYLYFNSELIGTTSKDNIFNKNIFKDNSVFKKENFLYFKKSIKTYNNDKFDIVFVTKNETVELLKSDFLKISLQLVVFILISFLILYMSSNKFIITPFSNLLKFAKKTKDNKDEIYETSHVKEFDDFAANLKLVIDELREVKEQYSRAVNGVEDGLWDLDLKTKEFFCSKKFLTMLGYDKNYSFTLEEWKNSVYKNDYFKTLRKIVEHKNLKTSIYEDNYRFLCKSGNMKWIRVRGKIFYDENNIAYKMTGVHTDIDEFIKLQEDNAKKETLLFQQSKLASMGEMIGNIAHQWRQPLNVISTIASSQIIRIELGTIEKEDSLKELNKLIDTVNYLSTIIDKFRDFFNPNKEIEEFYISEMLNENIEIFEATYKSNGITLKMNIKDRKIIGYKFELMQVIINIINNARDILLSNEGTLKYIFIDNYIHEDKLIFRIYDNGGGIKETIKEKIYEPYFTTKHKSQGTGLGLYMSNEIIKKHFNGQIVNDTITFKYEGKEYQGEEFKIIIPL